MEYCRTILLGGNPGRVYVRAEKWDWIGAPVICCSEWDLARGSKLGLMLNRGYGERGGEV